jgi:hypothetical protein
MRFGRKKSRSAIHITQNSPKKHLKYFLGLFYYTHPIYYQSYKKFVVKPFNLSLSPSPTEKGKRLVPNYPPLGRKGAGAMEVVRQMVYNSVYY